MRTFYANYMITYIKLNTLYFVKYFLIYDIFGTGQLFVMFITY